MPRGVIQDQFTGDMFQNLHRKKQELKSKHNTTYLRAISKEL